MKIRQCNKVSGKMEGVPKLKQETMRRERRGRVLVSLGILVV